MLKKEISPGIIQLTLDESRWYFLNEEPFPSVTWILEYFPKGVGFDIYLAEKVHSWEQAKQVLREAGEQGSRVHWGIEQYLLGKPLRIDDHPPDSPYPFSAKEWQMILDAKNWVEKYKPIILGVETVVFGDDYAGTVDLDCLIENQPWQIDWKTSQYIYDGHRSQVAAYHVAKHKDSTEIEDVFSGDSMGNVGVVRLGSKHKVGYEFWKGGIKDIIYYYDLFRNAYQFWRHNNPNPAPKVIEVPEALNLEIKAEDEQEKGGISEDNK
jgi:hypothetical protein